MSEREAVDVRAAAKAHRDETGHQMHGIDAYYSACRDCEAVFERPTGGAGMSERDADTVPDLDALLAEADALCEDATPGPWEWEGEWTDHGPDLVSVPLSEAYTEAYKRGGYEAIDGMATGTVGAAMGHDASGFDISDTDAAFIARARTLIPELCEALRRLKEKKG